MGDSFTPYERLYRGEGTVTNEVGPDEVATRLRFSIAGLIRSCLEQTECNQKQYAKALERDEAWVSRVLNAEENLTVETIARLFLVFDEEPMITLRFIPRRKK